MSHQMCKKMMHCSHSLAQLLLTASDTWRRQSLLQLSNVFAYDFSVWTCHHSRGKMKFLQILSSVEMCDFSFSCFFPWSVSEWAVTISGGLWHDFDVFCCCFNHTASCFSVTARAVSIMKNVLPSLPLNQRVVESLFGSALINLLEVLSWKQCRATDVK